MIKVNKQYLRSLYMIVDQDHDLREAPLRPTGIEPAPSVWKTSISDGGTPVCLLAVAMVETAGARS
jgi:hypothetical protein